MSAREKVLVIGDDTRSFLATVRSLGRQGLDVHAAPFDFGSPALASRYISTTHFLPYYLDDGGGWLSATQSLLSEQAYALVIPCDERSLLPLCLHRDALSALSRLAIPSPHALEVFFDKLKTRALAESVGVPVARGRLLEATDTADRIAADLGLPVVIKATRSYALPELHVRSATRIIGERDELAGWLARRDPATRPHLLERMFPGVGVGVSVLCRDGEVLQAFEHHRARELKGSGYYRKSAPLDPKRLAAVERMARASAYTGLAMFEFKLDPTNGAWILIEVNARPWGSLPLPVSIGVDFPYRLYRLLARQEATAPAPYPAGRYCRNLVPDMRQALAAAPPPARQPAAFLSHMGGWLWGFHRVLTGREHSDTLTLDDPRPGLRELRDLTRRRLDRLSGRSRRLPQRLADLAARPAGKPVDVLFVCQGNINRSSYAELKAKQLVGPPFRFSSAGMLPRNRRGSPAVAVAVAARHGVDMTAHRSRHASPALLEAADIVIAFDDINLNSIAARYPHLAGKACLLGEVGGETDPQILDPEGKDEATFLSTYRRIDACLDRLARTMAGAGLRTQEAEQCWDKPIKRRRA